MRQQFVFSLAFLAAFSFFSATEVDAFSVARRQGLFGPRALVSSPPAQISVRMQSTPEDANVENEKTTDVSASTPPSEENEEDTGSVTRTVLLAVPLFCKFVIVLLIKFVTDLIVFPLLFLFRVARRAKKSVMRAISGSPRDKDVNGKSGGSAPAP